MLVMHNINEDMNNKWLFNFIQGPRCYLFGSCETLWADREGRDKLPLNILLNVFLVDSVFGPHLKKKLLKFADR